MPITAMNSLTSTLMLALGAAACAAPPPPRVDRPAHRIPVAIDLAGRHATAIELRVHSGHVLVTPGAALAAELSVDFSGSAGEEGGASLAGMHVSMIEDTAGVLQLSLVPPPGLAPDRLYAEYHLRVPADVALRVVSESADVTVRGYRGDISVRTETGRVRAVLGGGTCEVANASGSTEIGGAFERARVESGEGPVEVRVPAVDCERIDLVSGSGSVCVDAPADLDLDLMFDTRQGVVLSELPVYWTREEQVPGRVGTTYIGYVGAPDRGVTLRVRSDTGNLELDRRATDPRRALHAGVAAAAPSGG